MLVGLAPVEAADLELHPIEHHARGHDAETDVAGIEPVVGDRSFGRIHDGLAVHEGGRPECRLSREAGIEQEAGVGSKVLRNRARQLHDEVVRMLAVDQAVAAVGGFTARKEQRIAVWTHQGVGADHRPQLQGPIAKRAARHSHQHSAGEDLVIAAAPGLMVTDEIHDTMRHQHPIRRSWSSGRHVAEESGCHAVPELSRSIE